MGLDPSWVTFQGNITIKLWFGSTGDIFKALTKVTDGLGTDSYGIDTCHITRCYS